MQLAVIGWTFRRQKSSILKGFFYILLLFNLGSLLGQKPFNISGQIKWCNDNTLSAEIMVNLIRNDSVIQTAFTDVVGDFIFPDFINSTNYILKVSYFGSTLKQIKVYSDTTTKANYVEKKYTICCEQIHQMTKDSLSKAWVKNLQTMYYYGLPKYSDFQIRLISQKYGVRYENLGCVVRSDEKQMNEKVVSVMTKRLGQNWERSLWTEMRTKFNK